MFFATFWSQKVVRCISEVSQPQGYINPLWPWCFRPVNKEELFNLHHAVARNVIECIFGIVKKWWVILTCPAQYDMDVQVWIPLALAALHNFILQFDPADIKKFFWKTRTRVWWNWRTWTSWYFPVWGACRRSTNSRWKGNGREEGWDCTVNVGAIPGVVEHSRALLSPYDSQGNLAKFVLKSPGTQRGFLGTLGTGSPGLDWNSRGFQGNPRGL